MDWDSDKRYSIFEIEQEMKLEKNQGEPLFSMALAKISSKRWKDVFSMILNEIIKILEKKFPVTNKEEWDNVGLMDRQIDKMK